MANDMILERAKSAEMSRDFSTAARLYKELLRNEPKNVEYLSALGNIYVKNGEDTKAIPYFEQIHSFHPENVASMNSLGAIFRRLKRYDDSTKILEEALQTGKDSVNVNYNLGFTYKEMGHYDDAIEAFESVIAANPRDVLTYNHLGAIYLQQQDYEKSILSFKRGLQIDPNHPILNYNLARCYTEARNYPDAIRCYEAALKTRPDWMEAIRDFSSLLIKCQKSTEAARIVKQSIKIHPNDSELLFTLGQIYLNQFDYENAQKTLKQASIIKNKDTRILTALAKAYESADKSDQALDTILKAIDIEPANKDVRLQYVDSLLSVNDYNSAFETIETMDSESDGRDVQVMDLYGQYYITQGEDSKAQEYFDKIKKIDHHYKDFMLNAAKRYTQAEKYDDAVRFAKDFVKSRGTRPEGYNALGKIYTKSGNYEEAKVAYEQGSHYFTPNVMAQQGLDNIKVLQATPVADINDELIPEACEIPEEIEMAEELPAEAEEVFDFTALGDDVPAAEEEKDEVASIADTLNEEDYDFFEDMDKEAEEQESFKADDILSEIDDTENQQPENVLQPEGNEDFEQNLPEEESNEEHSIEAIPSEAEEDSFFDELPEMPEMPAPVSQPEPEPENEPIFEPVQEQLPEPPAQPIENQIETPKPQTAPQYEVQHEPLPHPDLEEMRCRQMEMEQIKDSYQTMALENATKTAELAMKVANEAAKKLEELENHQKQFEEETQEKIQEDIKNAVDELREEELLSEENMEETEPEATEEVEQETVKEPEMEADSEEDINFSTVDELIDEMVQNVGDIDDAEAGSKLSNLIEEMESGAFDYVDEMMDEQFAIEPEEKTERHHTVTEDAASEMLKKIEDILSDGELAKKYAKEISLMRRLKMLCEYLPDNDKVQFTSGRIRMIIEYLLSKMSGRPGLLITAQSLIKSGVLGEDCKSNLSAEIEDELNNELIRHVLVYMKELAESLDDFGLSTALRACADVALERIELENQKSQIF